MSQTLAVALVQQETVWHDPDENLRRAAARVAEAARQGARVVVFPELFATGFTMQPEPFAEPVPGATTQAVASLAQRHGVWVVASLVEQGPGRPYNTAVAVRPDGTLACHYRKLHPFSFGDENNHYTAGEALPVFDLDGVRAALQICYDLRFPETFRLLADRGVELAFVLANWPTRRAAHWSTLLAARAIENQMAVCGVNRVGRDPALDYPGLSALHDGRGEVLVAAGAEPGIVTGLLDVDDLRRWRAQFPALRDRRPALYAALALDTEGPR